MTSFPIHCMSPFGRHCDTGEGLFVFNTKQGDKIYESILSATQILAATFRVVRQQEQV